MMFKCCECCGDRIHKIGHADACPRHQRAEAKMSLAERRRLSTAQKIEAAS